MRRLKTLFESEGFQHHPRHKTTMAEICVKLYLESENFQHYPRHKTTRAEIGVKDGNRAARRDASVLSVHDRATDDT